MAARRRRLEHAILLLGCLSVGACTSSPPSVVDVAMSAAPSASVAEEPGAPRQHDQWTPPASEVPAPAITTARFLFDHGLADPRGCEYRELDIVAEGPQGKGMSIHGWLLPERGGPAHAIAWDGLIHEVAKVGAPADVRADVTRTDQAPPANRLPRDLQSDGKSPLAFALLLRLGEGELASGAWKNVYPKVSDDPFLLIAGVFAWSVFDRAVTAHQGGDDRISLESARSIANAWPDFEAEAKRRGSPAIEGADAKRTMRPYFGFLEPLPLLVADEARRVARGPVTADLPPPTMDKAARIRALIGKLDEILLLQDSEPGGIYLGESPLVKALAEGGEDAVDPLIDCLVHDTRLTRSVSFSRSFHRDRHLHPVSEAALQALEIILQTRTFDAGRALEQQDLRTDEGRAAAGVIVQSYWKANKGVPLTERWFRMLARDDASRDDWSEAASQIVGRPSASKSGAPFPGEALRSKTSPSVSSLLADRIETLSTTGVPGSDGEFRFHEACELAVVFARWDPPASVPTLKKMVQRAREKFTAWKGQGWTAEILAAYIAHLTIARIAAKDPAALSEYSAWLSGGITAADLDTYVESTVKPIWENPTDPTVVALAKTLFSSPGWRPFPRDLFRTEIVKVGPVRDELVKRLSDTTTIGEVEVREGAQTNMTIGPMSSGEFRATKTKVEVVPKGPLRTCDYYAYELAGHNGLPEFQIGWPLTQRNDALKELIRAVKALQP